MAFTSLLMSLFPEISAAFWTESNGQGQFLFEHINIATSRLIWYLPTFSEHFGQAVGWLGTVQPSKYWFQRFISRSRRLKSFLSKLRTAIWQIILPETFFQKLKFEIHCCWWSCDVITVYNINTKSFHFKTRQRTLNNSSDLLAAVVCSAWLS